MQDMKYRRNLRFIFITSSRLIRCISPGMTASLLQIESILRNQGLSSKKNAKAAGPLFFLQFPQKTLFNHLILLYLHR